MEVTEWAAIVQTGLTGVLALLTYFYVKTTGRQLTAMREALEETRRSNTATEKSNEIAERSLQAAQEGNRAALNETRKSNEQTAESNRIARESLEAERRAWLVIADVYGDVPYRFDVAIVNCGGMPATDMSIEAQGFTGPDRENQTPLETKAVTGVCSLGNNQRLMVPIGIKLPTEEPAALERVISCQDYLHMEATIAYRDGFQVRVTRFACVWTGTERGWVSTGEQLI